MDIDLPYKYDDDWIVWPNTDLDFLNYTDCSDSIKGYCMEGKTLDDFAGIVKDKKYGLNYSELISPLIKAVQELSAKVAALEAR